MARPLNPLASLIRWRRRGPDAQKLYGAIVAQARLPVFYQEFGVPDTLEGRFALLSLHLFAVLHRLTARGPEGRALAQELMDRFSADMETVLRELGVGDMAIPKKVRGLAASSAALLRDYEQAFTMGDAAMAAAIAQALPLDEQHAGAASARLASYLRGVVRHLETRSLATLESGDLTFSEEFRT